MNRFARTLALAGVAAFVAVAAVSAASAAGPAKSTPSKWNYEIKDGKRVPKAGNRLVNADGSWREEVRQGSCTTIKEKSAAGEYKETRRCD
jgi:hypothetical protein